MQDLTHCFVTDVQSHDFYKSAGSQKIYPLIINAIFSIVEPLAVLRNNSADLNRFTGTPPPCLPRSSRPCYPFHVPPIPSASMNGESRGAPACRCGRLPQEAEGTPGRRHQGKGRSYTTEGMRASYFKVLKKAGVEGMTFHDLRHGATSRLCGRGLPIMTVQAITGHKSTQMLKRYTHISPTALVAAVRG